MSASQTTIILPAQLALPTSIVDCFNGKSSVYVENPWITEPCPEQYNKEISKVRVFKDNNGAKKSTFGKQFVTPRIYMRKGTTGAFSRFALIKYGQGIKDMKGISVKKPYLQEGAKPDPKKYKVGLTLMPDPEDRSSGTLCMEDEIMLKLDHVLTMALEFALIGINSKFEPENDNIFKQNPDDKTIIAKLCEHLGKPDGAKLLAEEYYSYAISPPTWKKNKKGIFSIETLVEEECSLTMLIKKLLTMKRGGISPKKFTDDFAGVLADDSCDIVPSFRRLIYERKNKKNESDPDTGVMMEVGVKFNIQTEGTPKNFPPRFFTKSPTKTHKSHVMNYDEIQRLYGVGDVDYKNAKWCSSYNAHIFLGLSTEYAVYASGQPHTGWYVDTIVTKHKETASIDLSYITDDILGGDDEKEEATIAMATADLAEQQHTLMEEEEE